MKKLDRVRRSYGGNKEDVKRIRDLASSDNILHPYNLNEKLVQGVNCLVIDFVEKVLKLQLNREDFILHSSRVLAHSAKTFPKASRELDFESPACFHIKSQTMSFNIEAFDGAPAIYLVKTLIHEFGHFVGQHIVGERGVTKSGAGIIKESKRLGAGLEEAIVEEMTKSIVQIGAGKLPLPDKEKELLQSARYKEDLNRSLIYLRKKKRVIIPPDEVIISGPCKSGKGPEYLYTFSYPIHRRVLYFIADSLAQEEKIGNVEALRSFIRTVLFKFMRYRLTGQAKEIAGIVNKAIGDKKAFKVLMQMDADEKSAKDTLKKLKQMRADVNKPRFTIFVPKQKT